VCRKLQKRKDFYKPLFRFLKLRLRFTNEMGLWGKVLGWKRLLSKSFRNF
jgi:hypothetical protein